MKTRSVIMLELLLTSTALWAFGIQSSEATSTLLYINPPTKYVRPASTFTVDIEVTYVEYLYDWQANMTFNSAVLRCISVTEGDFFAQAPQGSFSPPPHIHEGSFLFGALMIGQHRGLSGSGTLAHVEFEALAEGTSLLEFANIGTETYLDAQTSIPPNPPYFVPIEFAVQNGVAISSVSAAPTVLYINPPTKYVTTTTFTVDIEVSDVELLYDWQANITFNPAVLRCINVTEGHFLKNQPQGTIFSTPIIKTSSALFGCTTIGDHVGASGSGTLATVEFEVLAIGESFINFTRITDENAETWLESQRSPNPPLNFEYIEFTAQNGVVDSSIESPPPTTVLSIDPPTKHVTAGTTFTVDIEVSDVEFLYTWQANISFNPTVLRCVNVTEGDFLVQQPQGTHGFPPVIKEGSALFEWTTIGDYVGVSGSGILAHVEFEVFAEGESPIEFVDIDDHSQTFLWAQTSPNPPPPNFEFIEFTAQNGYIIANTIAPVTTIRLSGTEGRDGWFNSDVTATLSASGLSINETEYSFDNVTWNTYSAPFEITNEGHVTIYYRSANSYGRVEQAKIETLKIDKTPPTSSTTINEDAIYTQTVTVVLSSSASDEVSGLAEMRCSNDNITYTQWELHNPSLPWTLQEGDGTKTVFVQFRDHSGLVSEIFSDTIILDTTPPSGSIEINEDALLTSTLSVTISLTALDTTSGLSQIHFSHDNITWTPWETYSTTKAWTLTTGDGSKAVYVQFKDNAGLVSQVYSDTISLDTTPPSILLTSPSTGVETKSSTVIAVWQASDTTSGVTNYEVSLDGGSWINVGTNLSHTFTALADGNYRIDVRVTDLAGLTSQDSVEFIVNTSSTQDRSYTTEIIIIAIVIIAAIGAAVYLLKSRK